MWLDISLVITAYLLGSVNSAIILCRLSGLPDPRAEGSGNPGATNVLRFGGKKLAALVLLGDVLKGLIPVLVTGLLTNNNITLALAALAAFLGHLFPLFFGFRGGKGVATAVGAIFALAWPLGLTLVGVWLAMSLIFRISSLAAITAAAAAPLAGWWLLDGSVPLVTALTLMSLALVIRHHQNIRNILNGTEPKIGKKKTV